MAVWPEVDAAPGVALVTGGTGGIGAAVCRRLAEAGNDVAFTYRTPGPHVGALVAELALLGVRVHPHPLDLDDHAAVAELVDAVARDAGHIHTVVHAAGPLADQRHLSTIAPERFERHLRVEVLGFFAVVHASLRHLREARGSVVAVTSAAVARHAVRDVLSSGPKATVEALVRAIAVEEGRYGVRANGVRVGMLVDGMSARLQIEGQLDEGALDAARRNIPLRRFGCADDVADAVGYLASRRAAYVSGQFLAVDGGYSC